MINITPIQVISSVDVNGGGTSVFISDFLRYFQPISPSTCLIAPVSASDFPLPSEMMRFSSFTHFSTYASSSTFVSALFHIHGIWLPLANIVPFWARRRDFPYVISPHGMLEPWSLQQSRLKKYIAWNLFQKMTLQKASAFHATAMSEAEQIRRLGFKQPIAVIPNGVDLPECGQTAQECRNAAKNEQNICLWGAEAKLQSEISKTHRTALFLSRINPKKGLPMLLDVWSKLRPEGWQLIIAGNDDSNHTHTVEAKLREHGLQNVVKIVGPLFNEAKVKAFQSADLFVLPSYSENFGIVVTEALAYQIPVLTTSGCPWKELETHKCGWWVDPTHVGIEKGLRAALATSCEERAEMGARGRKLVEENYLWPAIAEKMLRFYEWVLKGGDKPEFVI